MGSSPSKRAKSTKLEDLRNTRSSQSPSSGVKVQVPKQLSQEQTKSFDLELMPQYQMQQAQALSTYQALPPMVLSLQQISRRENVKNEEMNLKVLNENPAVSDCLNTVTEIMNILESHIEEDETGKTMSKDSMSGFKDLLDLLISYEQPKYKKLLGDEIAKNEGGQLFTRFLKAVSTDEDTTDDSSFSYNQICNSLVTMVCSKSSDRSTNFCKALGTAGAFKLLVANLTVWIDEIGEERDVYNEIAMPSMTTLHNCAKVNDNKIFMKEAKVLEAMELYQKVKETELRMRATLTATYIIEEGDDRTIFVDDSMIKSIIKYLTKTMESPGRIYDGFGTEDLVAALTNLANSDKNKEKIVDEGVLPMLAELLKKGTGGEKTVSAKAAWVLSFSSVNQKKILQHKEMVKSLKLLSKMDGDWRASATGALWVLEEEKRINKMQQSKRAPQQKKQMSKGKNTATRAESEQSHIEEAHEDSGAQHVMISYQWDCQQLMIRVKDKLKQNGYRVWIDVESMGGSTLQAMAEAVEEAAIVLVCMSGKYKDSPNCRTEAEYAYRLGKPLVPLRVEQNYSPDGWLGALQGAKLYYDFSNTADFESMFQKLAKEIGNRGRLILDKRDGLKQSPLTVAAPPQPQQAQRAQVKDWTPSDVEDWASNHKIAMKNISVFDGETLLFLKGLKNTAPEFYYQFVYNRLTVTELRDLMNLNKALEAL